MTCEARTDLAPMDWKLQDSDDTTQPSVSSSPAPDQKKRMTLIIHNFTLLTSDEIML